MIYVVLPFDTLTNIYLNNKFCYFPANNFVNNISCFFVNCNNIVLLLYMFYIAYFPMHPFGFPSCVIAMRRRLATTESRDDASTHSTPRGYRSQYRRTNSCARVVFPTPHYIFITAFVPHQFFF